MRFEDVKMGMKVVPFKKSAGMRYAEGKQFMEYALYSNIKNNGYLFVNEINSSPKEIGLWKVNTGERDWFRAEDFEPYIEPKQTQPKKEEIKQMTEKEKVIQAKRERGKKIKAIQESFGIEKLIVNGETLVVFFKDGTKFVETAVGGDEFSVRTGIALAIAHHNAGSKMLYHEAVDKMCNKLQVF